MLQHRRRKHASFWEVLASYVLAELRETLNLIGIYLVIIFLVTSLIVGIYDVLRWLLLLLLPGS